MPFEEIEQLYENRGSITGLPTGFVELDRMTSGLHPLNDLNANDTYNQNASADGPDKPRFKAPWRLNSDRVSPTTVTKKGHRSVSYRINLVFFGIPPRRMRRQLRLQRLSAQRFLMRSSSSLRNCSERSLPDLFHFRVGNFLTSSAISVSPVSGRRLRAHTRARRTPPPVARGV
jgi:hypothetical protein